MKLNKLLFIALLALITFGCRTVKQTSTTKAEVKTAANLDLKQSNDNQLTVDSSQSVVDKSVTNSLISEDITVTQLSNPDSVGRQFATQTTVIHRTTDNKKQYDTNNQTKVNKKNNNKTMLRDKSDYKSDDKSKISITKETKTPVWVYVVSFVSFLILIGVVYMLLKRFGIIK